ncbi:MAG: hypothetical protein AAF362_03080 [Pseudomonadota bacterium]
MAGTENSAQQNAEETEIHNTQGSDIVDSHFDELERSILYISRIFFVAWSAPGKCSAENAFELAVAIHGETNGLQIAYGVMNAVKAMRISRNSVFKFNNPYCACCKKRVTECEGHFLNAIHLTRHKLHSAAEVEMMILCEGNDASSFSEQVNNLCNRLELMQFNGRK